MLLLATKYFYGVVLLLYTRSEYSFHYLLLQWYSSVTSPDRSLSKGSVRLSNFFLMDKYLNTKNLSKLLHFTFGFLTSSTAGGTSVRFLPMQVTMSLVMSQLHTLGHFAASTCKLSAKISGTAAERNLCICASKKYYKYMNLHTQCLCVLQECWALGEQNSPLQQTHHGSRTVQFTTCDYFLPYKFLELCFFFLLQHTESEHSDFILFLKYFRIWRAKHSVSQMLYLILSFSNVH